MRCLLPVVIAFGCRIPPSEIPDAPIGDLPPPALTAVEWGCDADGAQWELLADTTSWSGGGSLWLTQDAEYVEVHPVRSISAASDGSTDRLRVRLAVEPDWRFVTLGATTGFTCGSPPDGVFFVFDADGATVADCAALGAGDAWTQIPDVPACDEPFDGS